MSDTPADQRWRVLFTPRWLSWHLFAVVAFVGMWWLGDWQFHRAMAGDSLSWAYTFEWPIFAIFGAVFWVKTVRDELRPRTPVEPEKIMSPVLAGTMSADGAWPADATSSGSGQAQDDEEPDLELDEYNAYLAKLNSEVKRHGKWQGLLKPRVALSPKGGREAKGGQITVDADRLRAPVVRAYRVMAYVTGTMLIILCFVGIPLQEFAHNDVIAKVVGTAHGFLYIVYLVIAFVMTRLVRIRTASLTTVIVLAAGTIPVLTFVVERWVTRRYITPALANDPAGTAVGTPVSGGSWGVAPPGQHSS